MAKSYQELDTIIRSGWKKLETILNAHGITTWPGNEHDLLEWLEEEHPLPENKEDEAAEILEKVIQAKNELARQFMGR